MEGISTRLLIDAFLSISDRIVKLYNLSLNKCKIPACFKVAKVTPIPKTGDLTIMNNLRPISNTPLPAKILDKHVYDSIYSHMESNNLFFKNQNGFRKGRSTILAVNEVVNRLYEYRNRGEHSIVVFLDLSKAFNCVNHEILYRKFEIWGITGQCKKWIMEYLKNREQFVVNNEIKSECKTIKYGVHKELS